MVRFHKRGKDREDTYKANVEMLKFQGDEKCRCTTDRMVLFSDLLTIEVGD